MGSCISNDAAEEDDEEIVSMGRTSDNINKLTSSNDTIATQEETEQYLNQNKDENQNKETQNEESVGNYSLSDHD
eukprot:CAMPEP_0201588816 /NCGR_PEP_ID=MMETSP0190_2-20130828/159413_1 /ASSEMBLY_ACC=CAM_ASM_000263 /TAXON_ID=37353 /ORGANISM="Rosalina sp." /LENGTH=74 /DNA_ID=CAMNT_0048041695 /DNA_START=11 /DNA_END=232 /DNA_ORIENTATION=+